VIRHQRPRRARIRGFGYFRRIGPGFVTGAADDDPSGIGTYSQVGAAYGLGLLWSTILVAPMAAAVQETAARLGLTTEKGLATLIRERFPRPVLYLAVALTVVANTLNIGADIRSMAAAAHLVTPIPTLLLVVLMTGVTLGLELGLPYHRYSRVLRWLVLSLLAYVIVLAMVHVDWGSVLKNAAVPRLVGGAGGLAALIAVFGTTVSPYLFFWQASEEVEEQIEHHDIGEPATESGIRAMRIDVVGGMAAAVFVAFCIMVGAAATLHASGITTVNTAVQAAKALEPAAGDFAGLIFAIGIVGLGLLAVPVLAGATAYALAEAFDWNEGLSRTLRQAPGFYLTLTVSMLLGLGLTFFAISPIQGLYYAAILNGLAAPPLIVLMILLARSRDVLGRWRSGPLANSVLAATILASVLAPVAALLTV
jgi:NRAMP (natural resistance-associated macrophage protein)-like metal ion transporter